MSEQITQKWNLRYSEVTPESATPCRVLKEYAHILPRKGGNALDVACGLGGNAIFLANRGFAAVAWDISPVAIGKLADYAKIQRLNVQTAVRDVLAAPPEAASFDVIVVSYFLARELVPSLVRALRPGGLLFYQTWTRETVSSRGPGNPLFRLAPNELQFLFQDLRLIVYREEGLSGDPNQGVRDEAWLVAKG